MPRPPHFPISSSHSHAQWEQAKRVAGVQLGFCHSQPRGTQQLCEGKSGRQALTTEVASSSAIPKTCEKRKSLV